MAKSNRVRVNITVDKALLGQAKTKLGLFGGKLSTLFNAYLRDFVASMDKDYGADMRTLQQKMTELEERLAKIEKGSGRI